MKSELFIRYRDLIHQVSGIALSESKDALITARLSRRIRDLHLQSEEEYFEYLTEKRNSEELGVLIELISTNVTRFFRDMAHFEVLKQLCIQWKNEGRDEIRIWSAGCSSGEEPYTIAMVAHEYLPPRCELKILATDISMRVLQHAHEGAYSDERVSHVPEYFVQKYFLRSATSQDKKWIVHPGLRQKVLFRQLNFIREPLPIKGPFDAIFCRNVMIYFDSQLRQKLVRRFYDLLRHNGYFFISHTESLAGIAGSFQMRQPSVFVKDSHIECDHAEHIAS